MFVGITDDAATQNRTRMIMPMNEKEFPDRAAKTIAPNESLLAIIRKMYPSAKRVLITRQATLFPGAKLRTRPDAQPQTVDYTDEERRAAIKRGEKPPSGAYFNPHDVQGGKRKTSRNNREYYAPDGSIYDFDQALADEKAVFDPTEGSFKVQTPTGSSRLERLSFLNPFKQDAYAQGATLAYSAADMDALQKNTPVNVRIIVDPTDAEIRSSNGVAHDMATIAAQYSKWSNPVDRPPTAFFNKNLSWDSRARITADATNLYIELGKDMANRPSSHFRDMMDNPLTFHQLVTMPMAEKYMAWENAAGTPEDRKRLQELLAKSSLFTYDSAHNRYRTNLANYDDAHAFFKMFFGQHEYENNVLEDVDGAYSCVATEKRLRKQAKAYTEAEYLTEFKNDELPTNDLKGFRWGRMTGDLRDYQRRSVNFMMTHDHTLLANDQGTGKTASMLATIVGRMNRGDVRKALIVCPASLVTTVWPNEIEEWCRDQGLADKIHQAVKREHPDWSDDDRKKEAEKRLRRYPTSLDYVTLTTRNREDFFRKVSSMRKGVGITSFEMANLYGKELQKLGFDLVALDEAQNIKTGKTKTRAGSKRAETIKDVFTDVKVKIAATGTPIENSAEDLHSIVSWLNPSLLGPAESFAQDFIATDYVTTPEGKKQAVNVAIQKPQELMRRLRSVMVRVSKDYLADREEKVLRQQFAAAGKADEFNKFLHYGEVSPRLVYPIVSVKPTGELEVKRPEVEGPSEYYSVDSSLGSLIDLSKPEQLDKNDPKKYNDYIQAVKAANTYFAEHYKGGISQRDRRYGQVNVKATAMLQKMQQVLNDPVILGKDPEFKGNPLFNNPDMPNPKYDRLIGILNQHERKAYHGNVDDIRYSPGKPKARKTALETRGKTIIFCETVEAMKALKNRLEKEGNGKYRGRVLYYAGTEHIADLTGLQGNGKQIQQHVEKEFKRNPNYDILIANDAAQTGLSFPQADLVVNYELKWNPQAMNQRIDRAHRVGSQPRPVTAINIAVDNSVESQKLRAHAFKQLLFDEIVRTNEDIQNQQRTYFAPSIIDLKKRKVFLGDDASGLMEELIQKDPSLKNLQAASEESILRAKQVRELSRNAVKSALQTRKAQRERKVGVFSRWW